MERLTEMLLGLYEGKTVSPCGMVDIYSTCLIVLSVQRGDFIMRSHLFHLVHYYCMHNIHSVNYTDEVALGCAIHN
jgi:hypothetical protein